MRAECSPRCLLLITAALCVFTLTARGQDKPVWRFSILASIDSVFVDQFGGLEECERLIGEQLDSVNHIYNDPDVFAGRIEFYLDSLQPFTISGFTQARLPHPDQDYHIVYEFDRQILFNWLYPPANAILFRTFSTSDVPFPFIVPGNLVLAHELAHSRGAVDLYGLEVDSGFNGVNGRSFSVPETMMSHVTSRVWSEHTILLVNSNEGRILSEAGFRLARFPSLMLLKVVDRRGAPVPGAKVTVFGHTWYDMSLSDLPLTWTVTDSLGKAHISEDIFIGSDSISFCPNALCIKYSLLLLEVRSDDYRKYVWLPFTEPQTYYLRGEPFPWVKTVQLDVNAGKTDNALLPGEFSLTQNYPNPFNSETSICVTMQTAGDIRVVVTNVLGQIESVLHDGPLPQGTSCLTWSSEAASGPYFVRAARDDFHQSIKMLLLK